ncbi:MAG: hypothetical protein PHH23_09135 [Paludibacteraceae bacterium]|nr:hypothetical protein [Paludibacteraceae bacterium]
MNKKNFSFLIITVIIMSGCTSVRQIGKLNMISTRNIDTDFKYESLHTYAGGSNGELRKTKAQTVEDAVNQTVKKVTGGEFMMNVKLYVIDDKYFAVEGDVWGKMDAAYRGMKIGDKVTYKSFGKYINATIKAFKDANTAIIITEDGKTIDKSIDDIIKAE